MNNSNLITNMSFPKLKIFEYIEHYDSNPEVMNSIESIVSPKIIKLTDTLYTLCFSIMKLIPAKAIIEKSIKNNFINKNSTVVATSSGTFALGVALICAELGLKFRIFGDPAIDPELCQLLEQLGGEIEICSASKIPGVYQKLRLEALSHYLTKNPQAFWLKQYDNPLNKQAYETTGMQLADFFKEPITFVGSVGSGGSTSGIAKALCSTFPSSKIVAVDTFNSVLFGLNDGPRTLRGLGNSIVPKNLDHSYFDEVHWVSANDAYHHTLKLKDKHDLFLGPTSGAAFQVASYLATENPKRPICFTAPDGGFRYRNTVHNEVWLKQQAFYSNKITDAPTEIKNVSKIIKPWSFMRLKP